MRSVSTLIEYKKKGGGQGELSLLKRGYSGVENSILNPPPIQLHEYVTEPSFIQPTYERF